jgi:hypothetical protein
MLSAACWLNADDAAPYRFPEFFANYTALTGLQHRIAKLPPAKAAAFLGPSKLTCGSSDWHEKRHTESLERFRILLSLIGISSSGPH